MRRPCLASPRSLIAAARFCAAAFLAFLQACERATQPPGPPYLAIVSNLYAVGGATTPTQLTYHIVDAGTGRLVDKRIRVAPKDTVILSVPPSAYLVDLEGLPSRCVVSNGPERGIVLTDETNTGIVRYSIQCSGVVSVAVVADGAELDSSYVYLVRGASGTEITGVVAANDTATIDDAGAGDYTVRLGGIAPNCVVLSDGGPLQHVTVTATGGAILTFRINCSSLANRPQLLSLRSGHDKGASIFTFQVWDPDGDVDGYTWDLTDCNGTSVLPDSRERTRRNLRSGRGALYDTLTIVGGYETGLAQETVAGRCTEIRVFDEHSNSSVVVSHRIGSATGFPPIVRFFNAILEGQARITSLLLGSDPENDIVGHFIMLRLRDGVLGQQDGKPDYATMDPIGYPGLDVVPIPTTSRVKWDDILAVIAYVIDAQGNVVRVEDADIFR